MNNSTLPRGPDPRLKWMVFTRLGLASIIGGPPIFLMAAIFVSMAIDGLDELTYYILAAFITLAILGLIIYLINRYYSSIYYEFTAGEVIVDKGLITHSHKIVPYKNITNVEIKRGPIERLFDIASILIQTAGATNPRNNVEEKLDGIRYQKVSQVRTHILQKIHRFAGNVATTHDSEMLTMDETLDQMLMELQRMGNLMEKRLRKEGN